MKASFIPTCSHSFVATAPIFTAVTCAGCITAYRYDRLHTARARAGCKSSRAGIYVAARAASFAIFACSPASNLFLKCA